MPDPRHEAVLAHFRRSQQAVERASANEKFVAATVAIAERIAAALKSGGKVLLAGNGGSAADAQHIAAEFVGRYLRERRPLPAIALGTDMAAVTCISNDYDFTEVFARQVKAHGQKGDVVIAISTSGNSPNVLKGLDAARELGLTTIGWTGGKGGKLAEAVEYSFVVPSTVTARIQESHITLGHVLCELIEEELFATP